jgi:hypothetical protein
MVNKKLCGKGCCPMYIRTVEFDPQDLVDYLFDECLAEGYVPTEEEIEFIVDVMCDYIYNLVGQLGVEVTFEGDDE